MDTEEVLTVRRFISAINSRDIDKLKELMTSDHIFTDSGGFTVQGAEEVIKGWPDFFRMFPDYKNNAQDYFQKGNELLAYGTCSGTYNGNRGTIEENKIEMPAAWRAVVENNRIKEWQVYADWSQGLKTMEEDQKAGKSLQPTAEAAAE